MISDLWMNLAQGLRIALGRPLRPVRWRPRATTYLLALAGCFALVALIDYNAIGQPAQFNPYALVSLLAILGGWLVVAVLLSVFESAFEKLPTLLTAAGIAVFWYLLLIGFIETYLRGAQAIYPVWLYAWLVFYCVAIGFAVLKTTYQQVRWRSYALLLTSVLGINALNSYWYLSQPLFYAPVDRSYPSYVAVDEEAVYFRQADLLAKKLSRVAAGEPHIPELYFVGFAGNGDEAVFASEVHYVRKVVEQLYLLDDSYAIQLASSTDTLDTEPLANVYNLEALLQSLAGKMNVADDVLMLFLTSHGSKNGSIDVSLSPFDFRALDAVALRESLDRAGIQWRVIVVSACFSGSFIDALKNDNTIIVTAASAENTSFGCSSDRDLTYFGEALFRDALAEETDFLKAVESARRLVTARELEEELEPSEPQLIVGAGMLRKLQALGLTAP